MYLDHAATTPLDPAVFDAMQPYFTEQFGNPGSLHSFGQQASGAVFTARQMMARELNCHYSELIFTGSATEANNLAMRGAIQLSKTPRVVVTAIEHDSVLSTAKAMKEMGVEVVVVPVSEQGRVDLKKLKAALAEPAAVVSVMLANNEVGVVQPIEQIAALVQGARGTKQWPLLHTDAVQAFQYIQCDVQKLGVDLLTLSAHKMYGPKGIGALYVRAQMKGVNRLYPIAPVTTGGGQEQGLRSGTENVPAVVGFAKAVSLAAMEREDEAFRVAKLCKQAWDGIKKIFPKAVLNGPALGSPERLPNNLNFYLPGVLGEQLLITLDLYGVAISSGSACAARSIDPSHVLLAMGQDKVRAKNSLRLSVGRTTTKAEINAFLKILRSLEV